MRAPPPLRGAAGADRRPTTGSTAAPAARIGARRHRTWFVLVFGWHALSLRRAWPRTPQRPRPSKTQGVPPISCLRGDADGFGRRLRRECQPLVVAIVVDDDG